MASHQRIPEQVRQEAARWITERDAGLLTVEGEAALAAWLAADPLHAAAFARLQGTWSMMGGDPVKAEISRRSKVVPFRSPFRLPARAGPWLPGAIAASLAILIVAGASDLPTQWRADAMTATGERRTVPLEDGSVVELNTGSAISIAYRGDRRVITLLKGEAAFTVASDPDRPFTVEAGDGDTTALGTRFIVRRNDADTDVTVTEHSVRVRLPDEGAAGAMTVHEGQAVRYSSTGLGRLRNVDTHEADAWTRGNLVFVDRPLAEVVAELNRYHPGHIRVIGDDLARRRFSGVFPVGDPLGALDAIQQSLRIGSTRMTNRLIFLHS